MHTKSSIRKMLATRKANRAAKHIEFQGVQPLRPKVAHMRVVDSPNVEIQQLKIEIGHLNNLLDTVCYLIGNARGNKR